ncbi:MAG: hypothetical protein MR037_05115 [Bacteroidales bacterium]|nr:hypothetical protein [Bacteroidales bacterium]
MKKTYIQPTSTSFAVQSTTMLATSTTLEVHQDTKLNAGSSYSNRTDMWGNEQNGGIWGN